MKRNGDPGHAGGWCIHYRYNRNSTPETDACEAGVLYSTVRPFKTQPCFLDAKTGESKPDANHCAMLRRPTPEEIALHEKWLEERLDQMAKVMTGIKPWRDAHKGQSASEVVECPACGGRLHLSIAAYNGHVHGKCETDGCVSWME